MIQDSRGFVWIATQHGLNRFDGRQFDYFYKNEELATSISGSDISRLDIDNSGNVWALTSHGLDQIDLYSLEVKNWHPIIKSFIRDSDSEKNSNEQFSINDFRFDHENNLFLLINYKYVLRINLINNSIEKLAFINSDTKNSIISGIVSLNDGSLLLNANNCFYTYNFAGASDLTSENCFEVDLNDLSFISTSVQSSSMMFGNKGGFYHYDFDTKELKFHTVFDSKSQSNVTVYSLLPETQGYWLATEAGLKFWDLKSNKVTKEYYYDSSDNFSISNNEILKVIKSRDGALWLGTGFGISILKPNQQFGHLLKKTETKAFELSNLATSITIDQLDNLWVGTSTSGLFKYTADRAVLRNYLYFDQSKDSQHIGFVSKVLEDIDYNIWVLADNGLSFKPGKSNKFQTVRYLQSGSRTFDLSYGLSFIQDRYSNFWLGGYEGLLKLEVSKDQAGNLDIKNIKATDYTNRLPKNYLTGQYGIYTVYEDLQGLIWVGGSDGLVRFNPINLQMKYFRHDDKDPTSLSSSDINTIYEDLNGILWIGTSDGLNRVYYNETGNIRFKRIGTADGFVTNYISSIQADDDGFLWISTVKGLTRYHPSNIAPVTNYSYDQGLQHDEFYVGVSDKDSNGDLYFGGVNGVNFFNPTAISQTQVNRALKFTKISQGNFVFSNIEDSEKIQLKSDEPLELQLSNFDLLSSKKLELRYRLDDEKWLSLKDPSLKLHGLKQSTHLQIQQNKAGTGWVKPGLALQIDVRPYVWRSNYLWIVLYLLLSLLFLMGIYWMYRSLSRKYRLKEQMYKREKAKQSLLMEEKMSLLHRVEDLQYSLSEQKFLVDKVSNELIQQDTRDDLTGIYSRGYIRRNIHHELESIFSTWDKGNGIFLGVFSIEVDNFSSLKEQHGYLATNEILTQVTECLKTICYGTDILVRWEGACLVVLSRGISKREQMVLAEKIRNIIASRKFDLSNGTKIDITTSIGFTRFPFVTDGKVNKQLNWSKLVFITELALTTAQSNSLNAWIGIFSNQFTDYETVDEELLDGLPALISSGQLDYVSSIPKSKKLHWD